jgi:hypothetical protein
MAKRIDKIERIIDHVSITIERLRASDIDRHHSKQDPAS